MKGLIAKFSAAAVIACGSAGVVHAIPVTVNMTGDNILFAGLCHDATCTASDPFPLLNGANWQESDSVSHLNLDPGTYWFTWTVLNDGSATSANPAALLAEILWGDNANYSSSAWEVFNSSGGFVGNAVEWGANGGENLWTDVNNGAILPISTNASWIYTPNNFTTGTDSWASFRTSITVVPEPTTLSLLGMSLLGFGLLRRRRRA